MLKIIHIFCLLMIKLLLNNGELTAIGEGTAIVHIQLKDFPDIKKELTIEVNNITEQEVSGYIFGADYIRLDRTETYKLNIIPEDQVVTAEFKLFKLEILEKAEGQLMPEYQPHPKDSTKVLHLIFDNETGYKLEDSLAKLSSKDVIDPLMINISANNINKLGYTMLCCHYQYDNEQANIFKLIEIRPLW